MKHQKRRALHVLLIMGMVSLFGDITYEGGRSVAGPYLDLLGASAAAVGFASGMGELIGYGLRLLFGYWADKTRTYWLMVFAGYGLMFAIPLLAFAGHWQLAVGLMLAERLGKAIRSPGRDVLLSRVTHHLGHGLGFGIHEAMDQIGAIIGPLIFTVAFMLGGGYEEGYSILWIPAILCLLFLAIAKWRMPPDEPEEAAAPFHGKAMEKTRFTGAYWFYLAFIFTSVAGFAGFPLLAYHFSRTNIVPTPQIPVLYAIAMAMDGIVALAAGALYDKRGPVIFLAVPALSAAIMLCALPGNYHAAIACALLWGAVMGIHESTLRSAVATISPIERRGTAYGIFYSVYGLAWFAGNSIMGLLYERSLGSMAAFVFGMEIVASIVLLAGLSGFRSRQK